MKPNWIRILLVILISSCAANRIENVRTPDQLSHIKSGHFRGSELACPSSKYQHVIPRNKATLSIQSVTHGSAELATRGYRKWKSKVASVKTSKTQVEYKLVYRERKVENTGLDIPVINLPIKQTTNAPPFSFVTMKQKHNDAETIKGSPTKYKVPILHNIYPNQSNPQALQKRGILVYLTVLLVGLLSLALLKSTPDLAGNISYWAALNPVKARFIISGIQITAGLAGLILGTKLAYLGTQFSDLSKCIVAATFFTSLLLYPVRKSRIRLIKRTYARQKIHDLVLFLSGFMFMVFAGNQYAGQINSLTNMAGKQQYIQQQENVLLEKGSLQNPQVFIQISNQEQDKSAKPPQKVLSKGQKVFLTILTIIASVGLGFGVVVLSCELSCSGLNGLAVIVAIGGAALIAALIYVSMKAIFNPKHKQTKSLAPA